MKLELIALDIDGTLTNSRKEVTPETLKALLEAQSRGTRLMLASARPAPGLFAMRDLLEMREHGGILMSYNGGRIVDAGTDRTLFQLGMELDTAKRLLRRLKAFPVTPIIDDGRVFYVTDPQGYKVEFECRNNRMECVAVDDLAEALTFTPVKILMAVQPECLLAVQARVAEILPEELVVVRTAPFYLEIVPKAVNKGQGLLDVCRVLNIDPANTAAFGDAENDIPMLQAAGMGVAMGNAEQAVKALADHVTCSNDEDGIAAALKYISTL